MSEAMTALVRDGLTLSVHDQGGSGTPVVFQHGLCGDSFQTREAFPGLAGFRPITLECRGHGRSEAGDLRSLSIATFTEDVAALIESIGAGPVIAGGISMGAAISLRLAVKRPDLVKALILVRPAWITALAPANMEPNAQVGSLLTAYPPEEAKDIFMQSEMAMHLSEIAPDNLESLEGFFWREPHAITSALLQQISKDGPGITDAEVRSLALPALVIGHERDYIHPYSHAMTLADLLPNSTLKDVTPKATSKALYISDLHRAISEFLEEIP
jgi:pimeloyl-ACP methyl ester carboxylesterase